MDNRISFLVATYRMGPYITTMLDSIAACMRDSDELLIVDDGSSDATVEACQRWLCSHDVNARLFEQANQGVCASRNMALQQARGDYVLFLDGDDKLIPEGFARLRDVLASHQPDVLEFDFAYWQPAGQPELIRSKAKGHLPLTLIRDRSAILRTTLEDRAWALWGRLVRRGLLYEAGQPFFTASLAIDDVPVTPIILSRATSLFYLPEPVVQYRLTPNSLSKQRSAKLCLDIGASPAHALSRMNTDRLTLRDWQAVHLWVARMFYEGLRMSLHSCDAHAALFLQLYQRAIHSLFPDPTPLVRSLLATGVPLDRKIATEIQRFTRHPRLQSRLRALSARLKQH